MPLFVLFGPALMNHKWLHPLLMFTWLTVGFAVVHIAICGWFIAIGVAAWPDSEPNEYLMFDRDGEPVVQTWMRGDQEVSFRRLDGTPVPINPSTRANLLSQITIYHSEEGESSSWDNRFQAFQDFKIPTTYWYHVQPLDRPGTSYFEGFDKATRRRIGYLGPNGYVQQRPSTLQSFSIRPTKFGAQLGLLVSSGTRYGEVIEPAYNGVATYKNAAADTVWLLAADSIYEIQLQARTVHLMPNSHAGAQYLTGQGIEHEGAANLQLVLRTSEGLERITPESNESEFLKLDPVLSSNDVEAFCVTKGGRQIISRSTFGSNTLQQNEQIHDVKWFDARGAVERTEHLTLHYPGNQIPLAAFDLCAPIPMISFGAWFAAPSVRPASPDEPARYSTRFAEFAATMWHWLVSSLLIGLASGWSCWQRERQVFGRSGWAWAILVGICGWFGWVGYIFLRPLPARLPNLQWIPSQPEPNVALGIEIFA